VDVHEKLDELAAIVANARSMPMSASCIINRAEVLGLLEEIRELLPEEFRHAELLLADRESVVDEGRRERRQLTSETEVVREARREAERIRAAAREEAELMRHEVDDYVDTKLANFEVVLDKTLSAVHRGREKLRGRSPHGDLAVEEEGPGPAHPLDEPGA
jgi:cell division septum initiation protein DivIVA